MIGLDKVVAFATLAATLCTTGLAHDPPEGSTVFEAPIPGDSMRGAITFVTLVGPAPGETIVHAELDLTFRPAGGMNAGDVQLDFSVGVDGGSKSWSVHGFDLGWGPGGGNFSGTIDTDALFGQLDGSIFPFTVINLTIRSITGEGVTGRFTNSFLRLTLSHALTHDTPSVSVSAGGRQELTLDAGSNHGGEIYLVLGSFSGTLPGLSLGALTLPLNLDPYLNFMAGFPNNVLMPRSLGFLDQDGVSWTLFELPPNVGVGLLGLEAHHAFLTINQLNQLTFVSNASVVRFAP